MKRGVRQSTVSLFFNVAFFFKERLSQMSFGHLFTQKKKKQKGSEGGHPRGLR